MNNKKIQLTQEYEEVLKIFDEKTKAFKIRQTHPHAALNYRNPKKQKNSEEKNLDTKPRPKF